MPAWEVIYKATADFGDLIAAAAQARKELQALTKDIQAEGTAETNAAKSAEQAHLADAKSMADVKRAMDDMQSSAQRYNKWVRFSGADTPQQYTQNLERWTYLETLLKRAEQRGFLTPQQDYAYRQQELNQRLLWNRAIQQNYATPEQYLQFLQTQTGALNQEAAAWRSLAQGIAQATAAAERNAQVTTGTSTPQQLGGTPTPQPVVPTSTPKAIEPTIGADDSEFQQVLAKDVAELVSFGNLHEKAQLEADDAQAKHAIEESAALAVSFGKLDETATIKVDSSGVAELMTASAEAEKFGQLHETATIKVDTSGTAELTAAFAEARAFGELHEQATISVDDTGTATVLSASTELDKYGRLHETARVDADTSGLESARHVINLTVTGIHQLDDESQSAAGGVGILGRVLIGLADVGGGVENTITKVQKAFAAANFVVIGITAGISALIALLPALVTGMAALATVGVALPSLFFAFGAALSGVRTAITDVSAALSAYVKLQDAVARAAANPAATAQQTAQLQHTVANAYYSVQQAAYQSAQSQIQNAHQVKDAQFALSQAISTAANSQLVNAHNVTQSQFSLKQAAYNSAQSQITDAHNIASAQFSLSQAEFNQSQTAITGAQSVAQALHALQDSQFNAQQAQYTLTIAWQNAANALQDLQEKVAFASLDLRGAQLGLLSAQQNYNQVISSATSTALQRAEAAYQVQVAEKALHDVEVANTRNEQQLANVRKYGKDQVFGVTAAQHALIDAQRAVITSQQNLANVQRTTANAMITAAHAVRDAVFALAQAQKQSGHDQITNANAVAQAQFALQQAYYNQAHGAVNGAKQVADAQYNLRQAYAAQSQGFVTAAHNQSDAAFSLQSALYQQSLGISSVAQAQLALNNAMALLGPNAKKAVLEIEPFLNIIDRASQAEQIFFGYLLGPLKLLPQLIKPLTSAADAGAKAVGMFAGALIKQFVAFATGPFWTALVNSVPRILGPLFDALLKVLDAFGKLAVVGIPLMEWLAAHVDAMARKFDAWATSSAKPGSALRKWIEEIKPILSGFGQLVGSVGKGIEALITGNPTGQGAGPGGLGGPGAKQNLATFQQLLTFLSKILVPGFFQLLTLIANPRIADGLIAVATTLTQLITKVIGSPAFIGTLHLLLGFLLSATNLALKIVSWTPVLDTLGVVVAGLLALAALDWAATKFFAVFTLIEKAGVIWQGLKWILTLGKFGSLPGAASTAGAGATIEGSAATFAETVTAAGATFAETVTGAGAATGAKSAAGAGAGTAGAAVGGSFLARLVPVVMIAALAYLALRFGSQFIPKPPGPTPEGSRQTQADSQTGANKAGAGFFNAIGLGGLNNASAWIDQYFSHPFRAAIIQIGQGFEQNVFVPMRKGFLAAANFVASTIPQWWSTASKWFMQDVQVPVMNWVTQSLPHAFTQTIPHWFDIFGKWFTQDITLPVGNFITLSIPHFFTETIPHWFDIFGKWFTQDLITPVANWITQTIPHAFGQTIPHWFDIFAHWLHQDLVTPVANWITQTIPHAFSQTIPHWFDLFSGVFTRNLLVPVRNFILNSVPHFFTETIPHWFDSFGGILHRDLATPLSNLFTRSLPTWISGGLKSGWNDVANLVNSKVIGFINNDILKHLPGGLAIPKLPVFQAGGRVDSPTARQGIVPGGGFEDSQLAMVKPGEWVLRQPAAAALTSAFGPDFLPGFLNQADRVLPSFALGGMQPNLAGPWYGSNIAKYAGGGAISDIQRFIQSTDTHPYVWGGVGPGGYDCSGLTGEVYARLLGDPSFRRYFVTQNFGNDQSAAALGFKRGLGTYTVGVNPASHMVGNLAGLKFEARDTADGIIVGNNATDVRSMQVQYFLEHAGAGFSDGNGGLWGFLVHAFNLGKNLLTKGADVIVDAAWNHVVGPVLDRVGGNIPGDIAISGLSMAKTELDGMVKQSGGSATGAPGGDQSASAGFAAIQALGRRLAAGRNWTGDEWSALNALEMSEAGWNPFATNPSSGAYGIPQALPPSKMPAAALPPRSDPGVQINWMLDYIAQRYGDPVQAENHERAFHWYALGGPVNPGGPMIRAGAPVPEPLWREAWMALQRAMGVEAGAARAVTGHRWPASLGTRRAGLETAQHELAGWQSRVEAGWTRLQPAGRAAYPAGMPGRFRDLSHELASRAPHPGLSYYDKAQMLGLQRATSAAVAADQRALAQFLKRGAPQTTKPGQTPVPPADAVQKFLNAWNAMVAAARKEWQLEIAVDRHPTPRTIPRGGGRGAHSSPMIRPGDVSPAEARKFVAGKVGLTHGQTLVNARVNALEGAYSAGPLHITEADFEALESNASIMAAALKTGPYAPLRQFAGANQLINSLTAEAAAVAAAEAAWMPVYGPAGSQNPNRFPATPGIIMPRGPRVSNAPNPNAVSINSLITGGPPLPVFHFGGQVPGMTSLSGSQPVGEPTRALSAAGQTIKTGGTYNMGGVTINNPVQERAGESLTRAVNRMSFLAGRGIA